MKHTKKKYLYPFIAWFALAVYTDSVLAHRTASDFEKVKNYYRIFMHLDSCKSTEPYKASKEYQNHLRAWIRPLPQGGYTIKLPFKGNTYAINLKNEIEASLKLWHEEVGIDYTLLENPENDVNTIIMTSIGTESNGNLLAMAWPKGVPNESLRPYLEKAGVYLKVSVFLIPSVEILNKLIPELEALYDDAIKWGALATTVTPEMYLKFVFRETFIHELGHILGYRHSFGVDKKNDNDNSSILIKNQKQYDSQPSIMIRSFRSYLVAYAKWKKAGLSSMESITPSLQDIEAYKIANALGERDKKVSENICINKQISFDTKNEIITPGIFRVNPHGGLRKYDIPLATTWIDLYDRSIKDFCVFGKDSIHLHLTCYKNNGGDFSEVVLYDDNIRFTNQYDQPHTSAIIKAGRDGNNNLMLGLCGGGTKSYYDSYQNFLSCIYYIQDKNGKFSRRTPRKPGFGFSDYLSKGRVDWGYEDIIVLAENDQMHSKNRWYVDLTGEDKMSLCRVVGDWEAYKVACRLSLGVNGFEEKEVYSPVIQMGFNDTRGWVKGIHGYPASYCQIVAGNSMKCLPFNQKTYQFDPELNFGKISDFTQFRWVENFEGAPETGGPVMGACHWNLNHDWECSESDYDFFKDPILFHVGTTNNDSLGFVSFPFLPQKGLCYLFDSGHMACAVKDVNEKGDVIEDKINTSGDAISVGEGSIQDGHRAWLNVGNEYNLYCRDVNDDMRCNKIYFR